MSRGDLTLVVVWCAGSQGRIVSTQETHQLTTTNQLSLITIRSIILFPSIVLANSCDCYEHYS